MENNLTFLPDNLPPNLGVLICKQNKIISLPETLPQTLQMLDCGHNLLADLPPLPSGLRGFICFNNALENIQPLPHGLEICFYGANPFMKHCKPQLPATVQMYDFYNDLNVSHYYSFSYVGYRTV